MKRSRFTEVQITNVLKEAAAGVPVADVLRKHGVSAATFYAWRAKYGGLEASDLKKMKVLEEENNRLKKMYAELSLDNQLLKFALDTAKKF